MAEQQTVGVSAPSLPKGGGAIQSIGRGWGAVGATGAASLDIALPITQGRGYAPPLALSYHSSVGNGLFGLGWNLNLGCVARRASKGVPLYNDDDVILGPDGDVWMPERNDTGVIVVTRVDHYNDLALDASYEVIRYFARLEGAFLRIEHWRKPDDPPGFWLIHGTDGSLAFYGRNAGSRSTDPADSNRVAEWLLEETMNARGEHILYEYKAEDERGLPEDHPRDFIAQCYLWRVRYGNFEAHPHLYLWQPEQLDTLQWHFDLLFDYGERESQHDKFNYQEDRPWELRADWHSSFAYGFELGNLRFVHFVLMFHCFPDELGPDPVFVAGLKFEYRDLGLKFKVLNALQSLSCALMYGSTQLQKLPPVTFDYQDFADDAHVPHFKAFDAMPGLDDGQRYQLVDLYGEGIPGVLYRDDKGWMYREPVRDLDAEGADPQAVCYRDWQLLPKIPVADARAAVQQALADMTGDGRLDWIVAQPGMAGYFTLNPDRSWSTYAPVGALPAEFFHPQGQMADLVGDGLSDLVLIGPRSMRLYANRRAAGFAPGSEVAHEQGNDRLPLLSDSQTELVAFSDILGTGQQHLLRIRHNEIRVWPNLGRGRLGSGFVFAALPFSYEKFDSGRIRLADLDGSGAADVLYLEPDGFQVFMNQAGTGLAEPVIQAWPEGVRYDRFCQVSLADLQGLGCSSLVLTVPHMKPAHWRFDYPAVKPYLLTGTHNNMGATGTVTYRSSAQEWLDEKHELSLAGLAAVSELPFPTYVVSQQTQTDEITGNQQSQHFSYRQGFYDGHDRAFRGFGLVLQIDAEDDHSDGFTAPCLTKTWFHTGRYPFSPLAGLNESDPAAVALGPDLLSSFTGDVDHIIEPVSEADAKEMARTLAGSVQRVEVFGFENDAPRTLPYSVQYSRYLVRLLEASGPYRPYARMLPLALESISYQYEQQADDPLCSHMVNLRWDEFAVPTQAVSVNCARRKKPGDAPPFDDEHQARWWQAAHDEAQQRYYFNESLTQPIHLDTAQSWRLGLAYRARTNAMMVEAAEFSAQEISYEAFSAANGFFALLPRTLVALSLQRYLNSSDGEATFEALPDALEVAELDDHALTAYERLTEAQLGGTIEDKLREVGYLKMPSFLPEDALNLWSVRRGFNTYAGVDRFYRVEAFKPTASHGLSTVEYDPYSLLVTAVTAPDGCTTSAQYDYYCLQPNKVTDPNQNVQEALYDGFGGLLMSSFYGTEFDGDTDSEIEVGFAPLIGKFIPSLTPEEAISSPSLVDYATAHYYDAFSWMNDRQPVHSVVLQWDRYSNDQQRQQRMLLTSVDGFGRVLQTRQRVDDGDAYQVREGQLYVDSNGLVLAPASPRWRVSERVEYNNKGLAVRVYRPYFTDSHGYVNDSSVRDHWHYDKQHYDPLGRPTITWTAKGWMRRITYQTWYTISEDENDTAEEVQAMRAESQ